MNMNRVMFYVRSLCLVALIASGFACESVSVKAPLGEPVKEDLSEKLEGVWLTDATSDEPNRHAIQTKWREGGILEIAITDFKEDQFKLTTDTVYVTATQKYGLFNVQDGFLVIPQEERAEEYYFIRYECKDDVMTLWPARVQGYSDAVGAGQLSGTTGSEVEIETDPTETVRWLDDQETSIVFKLNEPSVLRRIQKGFQ
ncbi:hypothetical protein JXA32_12545 [Candidatus Sumerlaeota bacterium]|nr:hypothetical protein [Candidatus Sumerlaeota bacterium]